MLLFPDVRTGGAERPSFSQPIKSTDDSSMSGNPRRVFGGPGLLPLSAAGGRMRPTRWKVDGALPWQSCRPAGTGRQRPRGSNPLFDGARHSGMWKRENADSHQAHATRTVPDVVCRTFVRMIRRRPSGDATPKQSDERARRPGTKPPSARCVVRPLAAACL
jgi:hypothetical protein